MNARFQPDEDDAGAWAIDQVCGGDLDLTTQTFAVFCESSSDAYEPLLTKSSALIGPARSSELIGLLLRAKIDDETLVAVAREVRARYLADDFTKQNIEGQIGVYMGVA